MTESLQYSNLFRRSKEKVIGSSHYQRFRENTVVLTILPWRFSFIKETLSVENKDDDETSLQC